MALRLRLAANAVVIALAGGAAMVLVAGAELVRPGLGRRVARIALRVVSVVVGVRIETSGARPAGWPMVVVANHDSPVDIAALLMAVPDVRFAAATELFRNPVLAVAMRALDTVPIDRSNPRQARTRLVASQGDAGPLVVFPEGTIAPPAGRLRFKTGAFVLAVETGATIAPVAIHGSARALPYGRRLAVRPATVTVEFLPPISTEGCSVVDRKRLRDRAEAAIAAALARTLPG